jgi:hypothetical protein
MALRETLRFKKVVVKNVFNDGSVETAREPFKWFATTDEIAQVSAGVGLYFKTLWYFLIVMLVASLMAVYPIVSNVSADNTRNEYPLVVIGSSSASKPPLCAPKPYSVRVPSFMLPKHVFSSH